METIYDWVTVAIFAGLVVLFMQRSTSDQVQHENNSLWLYLGAGLGCAVANYIGNKGIHLIAIPLILATLALAVFGTFFVRLVRHCGRKVSGKCTSSDEHAPDGRRDQYHHRIDEFVDRCECGGFVVADDGNPNHYRVGDLALEIVDRDGQPLLAPAGRQMIADAGPVKHLLGPVARCRQADRRNASPGKLHRVPLIRDR